MNSSRRCRGSHGRSESNGNRPTSLTRTPSSCSKVVCRRPHLVARGRRGGGALELAWHPIGHLPGRHAKLLSPLLDVGLVAAVSLELPPGGAVIANGEGDASSIGENDVVLPLPIDLVVSFSNDLARWTNPTRIKAGGIIRTALSCGTCSRPRGSRWAISCSPPGACVAAGAACWTRSPSSNGVAPLRPRFGRRPVTTFLVAAVAAAAAAAAAAASTQRCAAGFGTPRACGPGPGTCSPRRRARPSHRHASRPAHGGCGRSTARPGRRRRPLALAVFTVS